MKCGNVTLGQAASLEDMAFDVMEVATVCTWAKIASAFEFAFAATSSEKLRN